MTSKSIIAFALLAFAMITVQAVLSGDEILQQSQTLGGSLSGKSLAQMKDGETEGTEEEEWNSEYSSEWGNSDYENAFSAVNWGEFEDTESEAAGPANWTSFNWTYAAGWNQTTPGGWWTASLANDAEYWQTEPADTEVEVESS